MGAQAWLIVVSRIMSTDGKILKGFLVAYPTGQIRAITMDMVQEAGDKIVYLNAKYDSTWKTLVGTEGDLVTYPKISENYGQLDKGGLTVQYTVLDNTTNKPVGVIAYSGLGQRYTLSYNKLLQYIREYKATNFKMINHKDYGTIAVSNSGKMFPTITMSVKKTKASYRSSEGEKKPTVKVEPEDPTKLPTVVTYSFDEIRNSEFKQSADDKFLRAQINLKKLCPYYFTVFASIKKLPSLGLGTMGVTEDTLYYDLAFVASLSVEELTFVLIHEMSHIMMLHSVRGRKKDSTLWNIATDMYINTIICNDFKISYSSGNVANINGGQIRCLDFGVFPELYDIVLDLSTCTPESIYKELIQENPQGAQGTNGQPQNCQGQGQQGQGQGQGSQQQQGQQGQQSQGQGQQSQGQGSQQQGQQQGQQGQGQQGQGQQGQGQQGQGQQGQGQPQQPQSSDDGSWEDPFGSQGQQNQVQVSVDSLGGDIKDGQEVSVTYRGKTITVKINKDVMSNHSEDEQGDQTQGQRLEESKQALQRAVTKVQMEEEKTGERLSREPGDAGYLMQRSIEFGLSTSINWKVILKNICKKEPKKTFTLANPNEDYMNMGITLAGRRKIGKPTGLTGIKIAIDVSGSVSKADLDNYLSEISNIFRHYKVDGELIYWSTEIGDAGAFSSLKDMLTVKPKSTGGTDVKCVFQYLAGEIEVNGMKEKTKPKDISCILIFTDGCFNHNYKQYEKLGKKVFWLITENASNFKPPFGRVLEI